MQNLLAYLPPIRQTGHYRVPYPVSTRLSLVDVRDVAEVAARVLTESGHVGATYELVGSAPLTQVEVAALIEKSIGQSVTATELPLGEWEEQARANGLGNYTVETLLKMFGYYAEHGLVGNQNVLGWLLRREPASLEGFVQEFRGA
jgi:uncharacterized protein YbjT (DUF2867 family)